MQTKESVQLFQSGTPLNKPEAGEQPLDRQQLCLAHALVALVTAWPLQAAIPATPASEVQCVQISVCELTSAAAYTINIS